MLPRWHVFWGAVFTAILYFSIPGISLFYLALIFLSSFLIDFDHYLASVMKARTWRLRDSFEYHRKAGIKENKEIKAGIKRKSDFHLFHTVEFHALVGLLGILWAGFFYVFIGMIFHSLLDLGYLTYYGKLHRREYFFFNKIANKLNF